MYQKLTRLLIPRIGVYFAVMLAFAGATALLGHREAAAAELAAVVAASRRRFRAARLGQDLRVLLEQPVERDNLTGMQGYTADYLPVFVPGAGPEQAGQFVSARAVRLLAAHGDEILAEKI